MSRTAAKKVQKGHEVRKALEDKGIVVRASSGELAEEAPHAYKDVDCVVNVVHDAGLARKVARLVPLGVIKGSWEPDDRKQVTIRLMNRSWSTFMLWHRG